MVSIRVVAFLLLTACGALCQQGQENRAWNLLPDDPSNKASAQAKTFQRFAAEVSSHLMLGGAGATRAAEARFTFIDTSHCAAKNAGGFFDKFLYPSLLKRNLNYRPSSGGSLMGRATYAASRILFTQDDSGRGSLNTSYFLAVLSSAAIHSAYRPYWRRGVSEPLSDFGSTIGNDAGMNLFHEFGPGLQHLMKSHAPKFVSRIEERLGASAR
jgi:hypothetical protein